MAKKMCPGQDTRFWKPGDIFEIACASCGRKVEFFKDDATRKCPACGERIRNPHLSLGCAQWCEHAKECLGFDPKEVDQETADNDSIVDQLEAAMRGVFRDDNKRIDHALQVLSHAREILKQEEASPKVVLAAAILHDIGIHEAEKKHGSNAGMYQEIEGPPIAREIMEDLGLDKDTIEHVCRIIANHHSAKDIDTPEFRVLWDADWLVNIPEAFPDGKREKLGQKMDSIFKTETGRRRAYELYIQDQEQPGLESAGP